MSDSVYADGIWLAEVESDVDPGFWVDLAECRSLAAAKEACLSNRRRQGKPRSYRVRHFVLESTHPVEVD